LGSAGLASALTLWLMSPPAPKADTGSLAGQPMGAAPVAAPLVTRPPVELPTPSALAPPAEVAVPRPPKPALRPRRKPAPRVEPTVAVSEPEPSATPDGARPARESEPRAAATTDLAPTSDPKEVPKSASEITPDAPTAETPAAP
jgi:hypothetical protein